MTIAGWRLLRQGSGDGVVLAVDFGPRTGQRGFIRLAERLAIEHSVYETVPPKPHGTVVEATEPERYLRRWTAGLDGRRVRGILAFCSGARFAGALAELAAGAWGTPPVILLDPSGVDAESLRAEFDAGIESLRIQVGDEAVEAGRRTARRLAAGTDLVAVADALRAEQRRLVEAALDSSRMPRRLVDGLCDRFATYVCYLAAAGRVPDGGGPEPSLVLATAGHPLPERYRAAATYLDLPHEELLDDARVAGLVGAQLADRAVHRAGGPR